MLKNQPLFTLVLFRPRIFMLSEDFDAGDQVSYILSEQGERCIKAVENMIIELFCNLLVLAIKLMLSTKYHPKIEDKR